MARLPGAGHCFLGAWETEEQAAEAYDRAVMHYRGESARRNFPRRRLVPADVPGLKREAATVAKRLASSSYRGVSHASPSWLAQIKVKGRHISLGHWPEELAAALAYDRAARFFDFEPAALNFPDRPLRPTAPAGLRRQARLSRKSQRATSRYRGVFLSARETARPWLAQITLQRRRTLSLGTWATERDAAVAYDRAARHYGLPKTTFNFPRRKLPPTSAALLASEARRLGKRSRTSRYIGVSWSSAHGKWIAQITHRSRNIYLGLFADERRAAEAYDARAIALRRGRASINFHPTTGEVVTGQRLESLSAP